jgi:hypothetical protein
LLPEYRGALKNLTAAQAGLLSILMALNKTSLILLDAPYGMLTPNLTVQHKLTVKPVIKNITVARKTRRQSTEQSILSEVGTNFLEQYL